MNPVIVANTSVWRTDLRRIDLADCFCLLSPAENDRAGRFRLKAPRRRYVTARGWLRTVLGEVVGMAPSALEFTYGPLGKPSLATHPDVAFSLSHSEDEAALVIGSTGPVGVDLEIVRPNPLELSAAAIVLSSEELVMVRTAADPDRALLRCWVRKEAYAKATGGGLERDLAALTITTASGTVSAPTGYTMLDIEDTSTVVAALALWGADGIPAR